LLPRYRYSLPLQSSCFADKGLPALGRQKLKAREIILEARVAT